MKNKNDDSIELDFLTSSTGKGRVPKKVLANLHEFYLSGPITSPEDYIDWFDTIRHAQHDDVIKLYINSPGGDLFTAIQFLRVLSDTEALVVVSVEGICASAATLLFLSADEFQVTSHSSFMMHNYTSGTYGKGGEQFDQIVHERKWSEKLLKEIYEDFLTPSEIESLLSNKDIWFTTDEVVERMHLRIKTRKENAELDEATRPD